MASRVVPSSRLPARTGAAGAGRAGPPGRPPTVSLKCRSSSAGVVIAAPPSQPEAAVRRELGHVHLRLLQPARVVPVQRPPPGELVEHPLAGLPGAVAGLAVPPEGQVRLRTGGRVVHAEHPASSRSTPPNPSPGCSATTSIPPEP